MPCTCIRHPKSKTPHATQFDKLVLSMLSSLSPNRISGNYIFILSRKMKSYSFVHLNTTLLTPHNILRYKILWVRWKFSETNPTSDQIDSFALGRQLVNRKDKMRWRSFSFHKMYWRPLLVRIQKTSSSLSIRLDTQTFNHFEVNC